MRRTLAVLVLTLGVLLATPASAARNFPLKGKNELSGGIGVSAGLNSWAPGGFKWFNDYSRELSTGRGKSPGVWFNVQLNLATGGNGYGWGTCYDKQGRPYACGRGYNGFGGTALELGAGVKLKWRLNRIPLQLHAKIGGVMDLVWMDTWGAPSGTPNGTFGVAVAFRGGFGVRYFVVPTLGVGAELVLPTVGPIFWNNSVGVRAYATIDLNLGVEWRF